MESLGYAVLGPRAVRVVIVREPGDAEGYRIALITADVEAGVAAIVARYADRWSIEVPFQDAKQTVGAGEARNRVRRAVERTVPFGLLRQSVAIAWYALNADSAADVDRRRREAPWCSQRRDLSMLDVLAALRRELILGLNFVRSGTSAHTATNTGPLTVTPASGGVGHKSGGCTEARNSS